MDRQGDRAGNVSRHRLGAVSMLLLVTMLAVTGCTSSQSAAPTTAEPATTAQTKAECTAVATAARNLGNQIAALANGQASRDQVRAAATELRSSLDAAGTAIKPETQADANAARAALDQLQTVLSTLPVDVAAARAATQQALDAVGRVLAVCAPGATSGVAPPAPTA